MSKPNPRAAGFNYGNGWGSGPKPPVYDLAQQITERLRKEAGALSAKWWDMEHALWAVRIAETDQEKAKAIAVLTNEVRKHQSPHVLYAAEE